MLSELVGPEGSVVGVDCSEAQLAQARKRSGSEANNIQFVEASAIDTRLPAGSFDLIYCRFLMLHLPHPERALVEMRRLLKPGGILICEDGDLTTAESEPPSTLDAFALLFGQLGPARGLDYRLGRRLYHLVRAAGFDSAEVTFNQPALARGAGKRLLELSVAEAGPAMVEAGLVNVGELDQILTEMRHVSGDEKVLAIMPRMAQVWARK